MFGFLNPGRHDVAYRRVYARCCQHQHLHYGLLSLPFLSYESVFLYLCAMDSTSDGMCALPDQACCRLRTSKRLVNAPDSEVGLFCSALSLVLAETKLRDDIRDGGSSIARFHSWLLNDRVARARRYLAVFDSRFNERIDQFVQRHLEVERVDVPVALEDYTKPTADAFSYVFELITRVPGVDVTGETLAQIGRRVGAALIAFDCAFDWRRDQANSEFNPLADEAAVRLAIDYCRGQLLDASRMCRCAFGDACQTSRVLVAVEDAIDVREPQTLYGTLHEFLQRWGLVQRKGAVQLNSDCGTSLPYVVCGCFCCCLISEMFDDSKRVHVHHHKGCG